MLLRLPSRAAAPQIERYSRAARPQNTGAQLLLESCLQPLVLNAFAALGVDAGAVVVPLHRETWLILATIPRSRLLAPTPRTGGGSVDV